jgi:hypothetical protein
MLVTDWHFRHQLPVQWRFCHFVLGFSRPVIGREEKGKACTVWQKLAQQRIVIPYTIRSCEAIKHLVLILILEILG